MKILFLITKAEVGGAQKMTLTLSKELKRRGHEVMLGLGKNTGTFLIDELQKEDIPFHTFSYLSRSLNPLLIFQFKKEFSQFLSKNSFDVIHLNSSNTLPAAEVTKKKSPKTKTVFTFRGLSYLDPGSKKYLLKFFFQKFYLHYLPFIDHPVFVSQTNREYANKINLCKSQEVVYNAPEVEYLSKQESEEELERLIHKEKGFLREKQILGSIGRLAYPKNYELIFKALPKLLQTNPNILFFLFGSGPEFQNYQSIIQKENLSENVFILQAENAAQYLKGFHIFVLPSLYEGLSITLIEALQAHIPIVASDVGGSHEVLHDDTNQLFESGHETALCEKIKAFLDNRMLFEETIEKNKVFSKDFGVKTMVEDYLKIYTKK